MTKLLDKCVCKNVEKESCKTKMLYNTTQVYFAIIWNAGFVFAVDNTTAPE